MESGRIVKPFFISAVRVKRQAFAPPSGRTAAGARAAFEAARAASGGPLSGIGCSDSGGSYINPSIYPLNEVSHLGFRVASVPEPATLLLLGLGSLTLLRKRKAV